MGGDRYVPNVWWDEAIRHANVSGVADGWSAFYWFAFLRNPLYFLPARWSGFFSMYQVPRKLFVPLMTT